MNYCSRKAIYFYQAVFNPYAVWNANYTEALCMEINLAILANAQFFFFAEANSIAVTEEAPSFQWILSIPADGWSKGESASCRALTPHLSTAWKNSHSILFGLLFFSSQK